LAKLPEPKHFNDRKIQPSKRPTVNEDSTSSMASLMSLKIDVQTLENLENQG
jgi:hypothetical protein